MVTRIKTDFKTSACYSWRLPFEPKLSNSREEEKLSGFKRLCLTGHVLEFSTTSPQKELSKLRKHLNGYKRKLWDWIMLRTKRPYQERLIIGGLVLESALKTVEEMSRPEMQSHLTSPVNLPPAPCLCLLLIPSLSSLIKGGHWQSFHLKYLNILNSLWPKQNSLF